MDLLVEFIVDGNAHALFELLQNSFTHVSVVFAKTCCEDDRIDMTQLHIISADDVDDSVCIQINSQDCSFIAFFVGRLDVTGIGADAGNTEHTGTLVQECVHFIRCAFELLHHVEDNGRIDIAGTCAHHDSAERCQTHGCVDALAAFDCGNGSAVAKMACDHVHILNRSAHDFSCTSVDIPVAGSMRAITADLVLCIPVIRYREEIGFRSHCLMECCIEYEYMTNLRQSFLECSVADQVSRVVQRSEFA